MRSGFDNDNHMTDQLCVFNLDTARYEPLPADFVRLDASAFHSASLIGTRIVFSSLPSWATSSSSSADVTTMPPDLIALETCADPRATTRPGQRYLSWEAVHVPVIGQPRQRSAAAACLALGAASKNGILVHGGAAVGSLKSKPFCTQCWAWAWAWVSRHVMLFLFLLRSICVPSTQLLRLRLEISVDIVSCSFFASSCSCLGNPSPSQPTRIFCAPIAARIAPRSSGARRRPRGRANPRWRVIRPHWSALTRAAPRRHRRRFCRLCRRLRWRPPTRLS